MIIVEGPDGGGKTTLAKTLSAELGFEVAHRVVSKDAEAMVNLQTWTERNLNLGFQHTIFDRHRLISEPIYGGVLRDKFEPGFDDPIWLSEMYWQFYQVVKPYIIYCVPPFEVVENNVLGDPDNRVVEKDIRKIYALYIAKATSDVAQNGRSFLYDFTEGQFPLDLILNRIKTGLR